MSLLPCSRDQVNTGWFSMSLSWIYNLYWDILDHSYANASQEKEEGRGVLNTNLNLSDKPCKMIVPTSP